MGKLILIMTLLIANVAWGMTPSHSDKRVESETITEESTVELWDADGPMMDNNTLENSQLGDDEEEMSSPTAGINDSIDDTKQSVSDVALPVMTPIVVRNVETLMDDPDKFTDKRISVRGEMRKQYDANSFVLKSGGIINDRIVVLHGPTSRGTAFEMADDDAELFVTGRVKKGSIEDVTKELGWTMDKMVLSKLDHNDTFLIADQISVYDD